MITSDEGMDKYTKIIQAIQEVLSTSKNDWIIYLQQEGGESDPPI